MRYLIKLEDQETGHETFVECPANMSLENLGVKIKVGLQIPYCDYKVHSFLMLGKVYVLCDWVVDEIWGRAGDWILPVSAEIQHRRNCPNPWDVRNSMQYSLKQVFTTIGSVVTYDQYGVSSQVLPCQVYARYWSHVRCTLIDRIQ